MKLVLFDIDGTLIQGLNEAQILAFSHAFKKVFNIDTSITKIDHNGKTDRQIMVELLKKEGFNEDLIRSKTKEIMNEMIPFFNEKVKEKKIKITEGAKELLDELIKRNIPIGLITGNLEDIAKKKMEEVDLKDYFKFGGFGSDSERRSEMIEIAIERAERIYGVKFNLKDVFVIGDTPKDIIAGKEAGVQTIAMVTGMYSEEDLKEEKPDFIFKNFSDRDGIIKIVE